MALVSGPERGWYLSLTPPPGTVPAWLFGLIWTGLYVLMGVAVWLIWQRAATPRPLRLWGWQLALSALWVPAFFALRSELLAAAVVFVLIPVLALTIRSFRRVSAPAAYLVVPYLTWSLYALYLDAGFYWLNPG